MSCTAAGAGAAATPAAAGASLARRRFLHSRAAHSNHAHRAQSSADSRYFQQQAATSCAAAHLQGRPAPWQQKQHGQQQHHRPSVAAAAAAAGSAGQPDAAGSSSGSWFTKVVLPTALVLLVCNMDRICLSVAILPMAQEYGWPATVQVWCSCSSSRLPDAHRLVHQLMVRHGMREGGRSLPPNKAAMQKQTSSVSTAQGSMQCRLACRAETLSLFHRRASSSRRSCGDTQPRSCWAARWLTSMAAGPSSPSVRNG